MDKSQAAEFLGVSPRTIDRLAAQGKLTKHRERRKTRPAVVFNEDELTSLKEQLGVSPSRRRKVVSTIREGIGFRLDPLYVRRLTQVAEACNMSPGEYARLLVIQALEGTDRASGQLDELRRSLMSFYTGLLVKGYRLREDDAERFVAQHFSEPR